jgi:hypothetical protein
MSSAKRSRAKKAGKTSPRYEVISVRLNGDRLALLERYRTMLADKLGETVSIAEAAFHVLEERAVGMDREASRYEMLQAPTASLARIRTRWASEHTLSAPEWDVLAEFVQAGAEEERQEPPALQPAIPSRASYLALLDAFEDVYEKRQVNESPRVWSYFGNLDGYLTPVQLSDTDADQRHQALLNHIAAQRKNLESDNWWRAPGHVGRCLSLAILKEGVASTDLDHILAPYWPTLWGLAARGHWIRNGRPIRAVGPVGTEARDRWDLERDHLLRLSDVGVSLSFRRLGGPEFATTLELGRARGITITITQYPELAELHAMLDRSEYSWTGKYFHAVEYIELAPVDLTLWLKRLEISIDLSIQDWKTLRRLVGEAWQHAALQPLLQELRQQYGEHG